MFFVLSFLRVLQFSGHINNMNISEAFIWPLQLDIKYALTILTIRTLLTLIICGNICEIHSMIINNFYGLTNKF